MIVLKPLVFILCFFFSSHFNLSLPPHHRPLNNHQFYLNPFSKLQYRFLFLASKMVPFCLWCDLFWHQPFHKPIMHLPCNILRLRQISYWDTLYHFVYFIHIFGHQSYVSTTYGWNVSFCPFMYYFNQTLLNGFDMISWCVLRIIL